MQFRLTVPGEFLVTQSNKAVLVLRTCTRESNTRLTCDG